MDDLEERVQKFTTLSLPGQPVMMHMGTARLVSDLWREVQRLRKIEAAQHGVHPTYGELPAPEVWTTPDGLSAPVVRLDPPISG